MIRVFIGGEGKNELGGWAGDQGYRTSDQPGVVEALLRRVRAEGWAIEGALCWKNIRKFQAGEHRSRETRSVLALVQAARELGCDVVAFVRDRDGTRAHPNHEREDQIEEGIQQATVLFERSPQIIGGVAIKRLESWILALHGAVNSEDETRPEERFTEFGTDLEETSDYERAVANADLSCLPMDARSLHRWLRRANSVFGGL